MSNYSDQSQYVIGKADVEDLQNSLKLDYFDGLKSQAKDEEISASFHPLLDEPKHGQADEGFWNDWDN